MLTLQVSQSSATLRRIPVYLVDAGDGFTPEPGVLTPTIEISKNGGAQAAGAGTWAEIGDGAYYYQATAAELDTAGWINLRVVKSGVSREFQAIVAISATDFTVALATNAAVAAVDAEVGDILEIVNTSGAVVRDFSGDAETRVAAIEAELDTILANSNRIGSAGNIFRTSYQDGVFNLPQGDTWPNLGDLAAVTVNQESGSNWPTNLATAGAWTVRAHLRLSDEYINAGYSSSANLSFSFDCTCTGSGTSQTITFRPGTPSGNFQPTLATLGGYPYEVEIWATGTGTANVMLLAGAAHVANDIRS